MICHTLPQTTAETHPENGLRPRAGNVPGPARRRWSASRTNGRTMMLLVLGEPIHRRSTVRARLESPRGRRLHGAEIGTPSTKKSWQLLWRRCSAKSSSRKEYRGQNQPCARVNTVCRPISSKTPPVRHQSKFIAPKRRPSIEPIVLPSPSKVGQLPDHVETLSTLHS